MTIERDKSLNFDISKTSINPINSKKENSSEEKLSILRPRSLRDFTGQKKLMENLSVYINAATKREDTLDHCLLSGPPGLGKTTLAYIIAKEMRTEIKSTTAPVIEKSGDMAALLTGLKEGDILFIDEIHRLRPVIEEVLYSAMEDGFIDIQLGQGVTAKSVKINLCAFTLIGATTRAGSLTRPLLSRFGIIGHFEFYKNEELLKIAEKNIKLLNIQAEDLALKEITRRSRGTPRILNRLLKRIRDFAEVQSIEIIDLELCRYALEKMDIDENGLDSLDQKVLKTLVEKFNGGPVGLDNLATSLQEDSATLEELVEPFLLQEGYIQRTARGRVASQKTFRLFNIEAISKDDEPNLFSGNL